MSRLILYCFNEIAQATNQPSQEPTPGATPGAMPQQQGVPQGQPPFMGVPGGFPGKIYNYFSILVLLNSLKWHIHFCFSVHSVVILIQI